MALWGGTNGNWRYAVGVGKTVVHAKKRLKSGRFGGIRALFLGNYTCPWLYLTVVDCTDNP